MHSTICDSTGFVFICTVQGIVVSDRIFLVDVYLNRYPS